MPALVAAMKAASAALITAVQVSKGLLAVSKTERLV